MMASTMKEINFVGGERTTKPKTHDEEPDDKPLISFVKPLLRSQMILPEMKGFGPLILEDVMAVALVYACYATRDPQRGTSGMMQLLVISLTAIATVILICLLVAEEPDLLSGFYMWYDATDGFYVVYVFSALYNQFDSPAVLPTRFADFKDLHPIFYLKVFALRGILGIY